MRDAHKERVESACDGFPGGPGLGVRFAHPTPSWRTFDKSGELQCAAQAEPRPGCRLRTRTRLSIRLCPAGRFRTEKYMQVVFGIAAVTLFVPVIYHRQRSEDVSGLDKDAPGAQCFVPLLLASQLVRLCPASICGVVDPPNLTDAQASPSTA